LRGWQGSMERILGLGAASKSLQLVQRSSEVRPALFSAAGVREMFLVKRDRRPRRRSDHPQLNEGRPLPARGMPGDSKMRARADQPHRSYRAVPQTVGFPGKHGRVGGSTKPRPNALLRGYEVPCLLERNRERASDPNLETRVLREPDGTLALSHMYLLSPTSPILHRTQRTNMGRRFRRFRLRSSAPDLRRANARFPGEHHVWPTTPLPASTNRQWRSRVSTRAVKPARRPPA